MTDRERDMTDEERALEWLDGQENIYAKMMPGSLGYSFLQSIRTLKALLARPRMPEWPDATMLVVMDNAIPGPTQYDALKDAYRALYAHLSAPKTKTVWKVEFSHECGSGGGTYDDLGEALIAVRLAATERGPMKSFNISPHEVPA